jgi:ACS family hexuronate transporter-like MFS transporter
MTRTDIGNYRWSICALLFVATTINYLDRQVLSLLAPMLSIEFGWSNTDYANIATAFQLVYAVSMLFVGRVVDRLGTKYSYQLAILVWSLGAAAHAYAIALGDAVNSLFAIVGLATVPVSVAVPESVDWSDPDDITLTRQGGVFLKDTPKYRP